MAPQNDKEKRTFRVGGDIVDVPTSNASAFLADFPDAEELESFIVGEDTVDVPIANREAFLADFPEAKLTYASPEKKSPSGSPSQDGLQGSQDGITAPSGGIKVPEKPLTSQLASLPPIGSLIDIDPSKPSTTSDPRKLTQEIEKAALSQAGLDIDSFRKRANDAVRQKELGEVEMEMYVVDGKAIPAEQLKDLIFDQKFIEDVQKGVRTVKINDNDYVKQFLDPELVAATNRNIQSGTRTGDKWESFMSGAAGAASGIAGLETMYYDVVEEVLGIPLRRDLFGVAELQETSEELARKAEDYQQKTFQYRENFLNSILDGRFADAAQQAGDATAASVPYSAAAAALTYAGGPALAFSVLAPMSSSAEYANMKVSEDEAFMQLSKAEKLLRSNVVGPLEAGTDIIAGRAISRSFDLTKGLYKGLVKEVAEKQGLEAADQAAKELSKSVIRKYGENIGLQMTEEFFAEGGATAATMLYDDFMGIRSYDAKDYFTETLNSGLLGSVAGGITSGTLGGPAAIYATGLTANNKLKSVFDKKLYDDPSAVENLSKRVDSMKVPSDVKEDLKKNLAKREKAVKAVPKEKVSDTETVDTVQEIQELEEQKKGLLPVYQEPIQAEIDAKTEKLKEGIAVTPVEAPVEEVTAEKTKEQKEVEAITKKMEDEIAALNESYSWFAPLPFPDSLKRTPESEKKWFNEQTEAIEKQRAEAESAIRKKYEEELQAKAPTETVEQAEEVAPAEEITVKSGPIQKQPLKPIPTSRNQFTSKLSDFSDVVYRETDSDGLLTLADPMRFGDVSGDYYFSNDPDLALGQGKNKGFIIEADASKLKGSLNTSKPGYEQIYSSGSAELIARYNDKKDFLDSILSITVKPDSAPKNMAEKMKFNSMVSGWEKIENADGSVTYRKPVGRTGEAAAEVAPTETVEQAEEVAPAEGTQKDSVSVRKWLDADLAGVIKARLRKEGISQEERNRLTGTRESPIITSATKADYENLLKSYNVNKQKQLADFEEGGKEEGKFIPEKGIFISSDTSFLDNKIKTVEQSIKDQPPTETVEQAEDVAPAEFSQPTPLTDAVQEQSTESIPVRQQPEARQGVREEDAQGQETPQEGEAVQEEVVADGENLLPDFKAVPMESVTTDEARFQGRESLDEENVQKIIDEFDERKLDPIVAWRDPDTNTLTVLSGHHRFEAARRMGRKDIPVREFIGTEQEAIDFARDSNVMGKQETPVERAGRYRQMREQGISEAEIQRRARSAHGKDAAFMVNISRLDPKGKAMDAMRQFNESTDKSTRSRIEAIADWIGALKKTHPDVSKAQESEMFDYLLEVYSPKSQRGKISTRNQFVDVASAVIDRMKNNGTFNEDAVLNLGNVAGKGSLEMEYDAKLEEAKQREADARKAIETRRAELVMIGTDPKKNEKKLTPSQIDRALVPYEDALRIAIREVGEIRATKETAIAGDRAQISLFDEIAEPTTPTDEITERRIEGVLEEGREQTQAPKRDTGRVQAEIKPSKPKVEPTEKTDTQKLLEEKMAERERKRKEIEDRIKQTKGDIWDDLNKLGIATDPEQQAAETKKMQDQLISIAKDYISLGMMNVEDFIASVIENYKGKRTDMVELAEAAFKKAKSEQEPSGKKSSEKASERQSQKRYTTRVIKNLEKLADKKELLEAVRETGTKESVISWKSLHPIALEMVEDIFSDPKSVNEKMKELSDVIDNTTNRNYRENKPLSTLHALIYHIAIDRLANEGMTQEYKIWVSAFQDLGRSKGRFNSAMQEAASSYAVKNLVVRPVFDADMEKLNEKAEDGETRAKHVEDVKELYDAILQSDELIDLLQKRVGELEGQVEYYRDTQRPEASQPLDRKRQLKKEKDEALQMIRRGLAKARGQANVGMPLNEDLINGTIALAKYYVKVGIYKAADLKKMVMKEVVDPSKDNPDMILQVADAIDSYLASDEFKDSRKEAMKAAFVDALESRAKAMMGNERATRKSAEQVLLDSLLSKLASDIGKDAKKGSKAYEQRLREALENADFSDSVWKAAMENVRIWMDMQDMAPTTKAEILSRLEDTASAFMEKPFAKSDIRKAIREGEKDLGTSLADVVKRHFTEQNSTLKTLAEKLVSELGLSAEAAKKYEQAIIEEARSYMSDKRMSAIQKALGVDSAGMPKEKAKKVNKAIVDRMIEGINLGMLDDDLFRGMFAEKYGLIDLTPEMVANINRFNDLIHLHEGTDVSRRYKKELMDYIETLKPWNVAAFAKLTQGLVIKNMLNGLATFLNISAGSMYSFFTGIGPSVLMNIPATKAFFDEYSRAGLSSSSRRMFKDIMIDGRSPIDEGLGGKFDDGEVTGDRFEYFVKEYDVKKLRETFSNAKTPKEVGTATLIAAARAFSLISQLSNFAKAFDVLLSNRGTEFEMFLKYYNEMSKEAGHPLRARFDPSVSKQFIDRLREKMAYDPDARAEIETSVDEQIAGMKARGEKVGAATRQVLIREGMVARRDMKEYRQAMDRVRSYLLMEDPNGLLGQMYDTQRGWGTIKGDEGAAKALAKLGYSLTFGLFLRISITATQRSIENIPVAGLLAPGFLYDYTRTDPSDPRSPKKWMGMFERKGGELVKNEMYDHKAMKRRLAVHAMIAGLTVAAGWNMFVLKEVEDEEEDEEGNIKTVKKTRLDINPDRVIEFTAHSGEFFKAEQFSGLDTQGSIDRRRDYYFRVKVGGKWENVAPTRLNPYFLFPTAVLGGIADDITLGMSKNERKRDAILNTWDDLAMGLAEFSFAGNAKLIRNTIYATQRGGVLEGAAEVGEFVLKPARVAIYPNALRDVYKEMRAIQGQEEKYGEGMLGALSNDIPVLEDMVGISSYDIFGYPKKVTSKFIQVGTDIPVAGIFIDNVIDHKYRNEERFDTDAWKLKMTYFPDVEIQGYWPKNTKNVTVTREMKNEASKVYGEFMRSAIEATPKDVWENLSQGDIDRAINGRIMIDGSRKGSGIHHAAVEVAKASIGISEMGKLAEIENSVRTELKEVREKSVQTEADEAMKSYLVDALQTISDVRKQLEQKTKK